MRAPLRALALTGVLFLAACPGGKRSTDPEPQREAAPAADAAAAAEANDAAAAAEGNDAMTSITKDPNAAPGAFTRGPAITPAAELVAWLDATRTDVGQRKVRLPVWISVAGVSIKAARIGAADSADAVALKLKDAALGISLADHVRRACRGAPACGLWLEGKWGGDGRFDIAKVGAGFTAADDATYVEVEP